MAPCAGTLSLLHGTLLQQPTRSSCRHMHCRLLRLLCPPLTRPAWLCPDMTAGQHAQAFQAFFQRPLQLTCDWAHRCLLTDPSSSEYLTVLKQDRQSWLLVGPCLHPDLVIMLHDRSMQGLYHLPVQG